jgi:hypothetical protein
MNSIAKHIGTWALVFIAGRALTQDGTINRLSAVFSDPSQPGRIEASIRNGGITVVGYEGREVLIEGNSQSKPITKPDDSEKARGMRRLTGKAFGIEVEEEDNVMTISEGSESGGTINLNLRVPRKTSLNLSCVNSGNIKVENIEGDLEIENVNGGIILNNVSGSVVANTVNKDLNVVFDWVDPQKPMSFSSVNGEIDVTLPAAVKADVTLKSDRGEIYTDFDAQLIETTEKTEEDNRNEDGKYRISIDHSFQGRINGGGPEYQFCTFNGNIYLRKK